MSGLAARLGAIGPVRLAIVFAVIHLSIGIVFSFFVYPALEARFEVDITQDEYDDLAWSMAQGRGFRSYHGEESVIRGPGYPALLAGIYLIAGHNFQAVQAVQAVLSALIVWFTFLIGRRIAGDNAGLVAALAMAFNPLLIWYIPRIMVEVPFTLLCLLAFHTFHRLSERWSWSGILLAGVWIAGAAYIKSIALVFPAVLLVLLLLAKSGWQRALVSALAAGVVAAALITPWTLRNYQLTGRLIPVHVSLALPLTQGDLYVRHFAGSPFNTKPAMAATYQTLREISVGQGFRPITYPLTSLRDELDLETAVGAHFAEVYRADPLYWLQGTAIRSLLFWYYSSSTLFSLVLLGLNALILIFAVPGFFMLKGKRERWIPVVWLAVWLGLHAPLIASARFTLQMQPYLLALAAVAVLRLLRVEVESD